MPRVIIPKNADQLVQLSKAIVAKDAADGAGSPLSGLNMKDMADKTTTADTQNQTANKLYRDAEKSIQNRDLALGADNPVQGTVTYYVRSARDVLLGLFKGNEQKLGDWGFEVDQSAQAGGNAKPAPGAKTS